MNSHTDQQNPTTAIRSAASMKVNRLFVVALIVFATYQLGEAQKLSDVVRWNNGKAYLFYETGQYIRFDIATDKAEPGYPKPIVNNWPGVFEKNIDAVLTWKDGKAYFFKGAHYTRYDMANDRADEGYPARISDHWPGVWTSGIDAAVMWNDGFAYFFKGDDVVQYDVDEKKPAKTMKISERFNLPWRGDIDAAVLWDRNTAYFFKGKEYVRYDAANNKPETRPQSIMENWHGLTRNQAAYFGWRGYADTNLSFAQFFQNDHTITARFMPQYPNGYGGPILGESTNGAYFVGQGLIRDGVPQLIMKVGGKEQVYASSALASKAWVNLAVVRSGNIFKLFINGTLMHPAIVINPTDNKLPTPNNLLRLGRRTDGHPTDGAEGQFYGLIDDVLVFTRAFTSGEIEEIKNNSGHPLKRNETNLIRAWLFDDFSEPPKVVTDSRVIFKSLTPGMAPSGITLVSQNLHLETDRGLLPLAFQQVKRLLPFKKGQEWYVVQGMNNPEVSHYGRSAFSIDFALAGEESKNKVPNSHGTGRSCGEPLFAMAGGVVTERVEAGGGEGDDNDFDGPNHLYVRHTFGEETSYAHVFTGSISMFIPNQNLAHVQLGQKVALVGTLNGCHLHTGVFENTTTPINFPQEFSDYEVSDDEGTTWRRVDRGTPKEKQWVRRPMN